MADIPDLGAAQSDARMPFFTDNGIPTPDQLAAFLTAVLAANLEPSDRYSAIVAFMTTTSEPLDQRAVANRLTRHLGPTLSGQIMAAAPKETTRVQ